MERMSGSDAFLLHMEDRITPMHTLKVVILDPTRMGRDVTLDELALVVGSRLGLVPRATQKAVFAPGFRGRPFWVHDPDFDLRRHLEERTLPTGSAAELDALYGELATRFLPRDRALWAMTLVHGLEGGRQAVVARIHHAVVDGLGALNTMLAISSDDPSIVAPSIPAPAPSPVRRRRLFTAALIDTVRTTRTLPSVLRGAADARRRSGRTPGHPDIPSFFSFRRSSINAAGGATRVCASTSLDLETMRAIGKASGTTINGVWHAVIAAALREELVARGEDVSTPCRAAFGIASNTNDSDRLCGNAVTPTFVNLRSDLDDPRERLQATARSCRVAVAARREAGLDLTDQMSAYAPRVLNASRRVLAHRTTMNPSHVVTANVPGPQHQRWIGDVAVVDWFSFAVAVNPASVNITAHSYDGRLNVGVVADPAALPDPQILTKRLIRALEELEAAILGRRELAVA